MMLPLSIWAPIGKEAWWAGRHAIETGEFAFVYTPDGQAFSELKLYASKFAAGALARLQAEQALTPANQTHIMMMYIHAFVNGALDQILSEQPTES